MTIFKKIIDREIPAEIVFEDDDCICIKDINPQAATHVLLIPKPSIEKLSDAKSSHADILGKLMLRVGDIARQLKIDDAFRVVINNGEKAGQTVFQLHLHILADKNFSEQGL